MTRLVSPAEPTQANRSRHRRQQQRHAEGLVDGAGEYQHANGEPQAAGIGYRTSNPRAVPAIAQPQIHKSSLRGDDRAGSSAVDRLSDQLIGDRRMHRDPPYRLCSPKPVPNGVEKVSLTLSAVTPMMNGPPANQRGGTIAVA